MNAASDRVAQIESAFPSHVDGVFVATSGLAQRLDLMRHLIEFSDLLLLVAGPGGAGKSAFIAELLREPGERWRVCEVVAPDGADADTLLGLILSGYGLRCGHHDSREQRVQMLEAHLENQQRHGLVSLIVVDAVERLSAEAMGMACDLAGRFEGVRPRLLLAGESETLLPLAAPENPSAAFTHLLVLPPFSPAEAFSYVQARLAAAGLPADALPETHLRTCLDNLQALPGTINEAVRAEAVRLPSMSAPARPPRSAVPRPGWRPLLLVLGGAVGLTLLLYPSPEEPAPPAEAPATADAPPLDVGSVEMEKPPPVVGDSVGPGETPVVDPPEASASVETVEADGDTVAPGVDASVSATSAGASSTAQTPASVEQPATDEALPVPGSPADTEAAPPPAAAEAAQTAAVEPTDAAEPATAAEGAVEPSAADGTTTVPADALPAASDVVQGVDATTDETPAIVPLTDGSEVEVAQATPPDVAATATAPPAPEAKSPAAEPEPEPPVAAETPADPPVPAAGTLAWLQAQPRGNFTVQLAGSQSRSGAERFVRRHGLDGRAVVVRTRRGDADWFIVVDGSHAQRDAARAAIGRLPAALRRDSPWLRPISEVISLSAP